ncbi:amidohydrolase [Sphingomonas sp. DBB INV C78]|uniref:N-acyl-D-amino-acid deacylase family protein n=1 Tax=Sphingomonas sp. DBB INV C78 TaxID=3349434 RepID=UPI0036D38655
MADFDLVVRGGTVLDGSGSEAFEADIGIRGSKIVEIGTIRGRGREEIDAHGLLVTPGFVDIHTHYDGQITWEERLAPSSNHGVTTVVMGNCGVGFAPCKPEHRDMLIHVMEGVEDIPEAVMAEGLPWTWESFPDYLDMLDTRRSDVDFAAQLPHAPVRVHVMGERGARREPATDADLEAMTRIVQEAVSAGALGVTTSRSLAHRTREGELAPTVTSEERELQALAQGLKLANAGVFQLIPGAQDGAADPAEEMALFRRITQTSGRPLSFSLLHQAQRPGNTARVLELLEQANDDGLPIRAQVFPRPVGVLFGLDLSFHPFRFRPSYAAIEHLPLAERVAAMRDPEMRRRLLSEEPEHSNEIFLWFSRQSAELYPLGCLPDYEPLADQNVGIRAAALGVRPEELAYDLLLEQEGHATLLLPASNYVDASLEPVRQLLEHPHTLVALGDGGAHYGMICDSSFPTSVLAYWTRDRSRGPRLALPDAIRRLSRSNALAVGLEDRGLIAPGLKADINLIDYAALQLDAPRAVYDLPGGGRRLRQEAHGYRATIVSGEVTYQDGMATGALPGRLVRGAWTRH